MRNCPTAPEVAAAAPYLARFDRDEEFESGVELVVELWRSGLRLPITAAVEHLDGVAG